MHTPRAVQWIQLIECPIGNLLTQSGILGLILQTDFSTFLNEQNNNPFMYLKGIIKGMWNRSRFPQFSELHIHRTHPKMKNEKKIMRNYVLLETQMKQILIVIIQILSNILSNKKVDVNRPLVALSH